MAFTFKKFRSYFHGTEVIVHTDHSALKYPMAKKDAKPRLIRWVLLLQEFDLEVKDRKGIENQVADHLSRLEEETMLKLGDGAEINNAFPNEQVLAASCDLIPWFANFANYLASDLVPLDLSFHQRKKFMSDVKKFFRDEPYLFHVCADVIIHRCVPKVEKMSIFEACHSSLLVGTIVVFRLLIKSRSVGITGLPSTKMLMILPSLVIVDKEKERF